MSSQVPQLETEFPIFYVVGRPRSGTTLLRVILNAHPSVIIPPECQFIINLYKKYRQVKCWTAPKIDDFINDLKKQWKFDTWHIDSRKLVETLHSLEGAHSYAKVCKSVYLTYGANTHADSDVHLGDKNPGYTLYMEKLARIFPDAKFIFLQRDFRDNYVSLIESGFELPIPSYAAFKWRYYFKQALKFQKRHPDKIKILKYEEFIQKPQETFSELCNFLDIQYIPSLLTEYEARNTLEVDYPGGALEKFHLRLTGGIKDSRIGIWKHSLKNSTVRLLEAGVGSIAFKAGYPLTCKNLSFRYKLMALPGIGLAGVVLGLTAFLNLFPADLRMIILSKLPRRIAVGFFWVFNRKKYHRFKLSSDAPA